MSVDRSVRVQFHRVGGRPTAVIQLADDARLEAVQGAIAGIFHSKELLPKLGLKFCEGCKSGLDINIRDQFEFEIDVPVLHG